MCFFFQAEDGIRDLTVTGVQTCALPISAIRLARFRNRAGRRVGPECLVVSAPIVVTGEPESEIGRASCRERSVDLGGRRIIKKKKGNAVRSAEGGKKG